MDKIKLLLTCFMMIVTLVFHIPVESKPKILHLSFHLGCIKDFEMAAKKLELDLTSWWIVENEQSRYKFDPQSAHFASVFNIGHERAERIWNIHKEYFYKFDAIITSDTAPLSRIFLQNNWHKPLIIWICNRFDYYDGASLDCNFPDAEYYSLFKKAAYQKNVKIVGYVAYEHFYAKQKGVNTGDLVIKPCGSLEDAARKDGKSLVPESIIKNETFLIPPRLDSHQVNYILNICRNLGIKAYCGPYNGPYDIKDFKGIIHFPYAWSNIALFENMHLGLPHFVPTIRFLRQIHSSHEREYFRFFSLDNLEYSEWYNGENDQAIVYFDSWQDLKQKIHALNFGLKKTAIIECAKKHSTTMVERWKNIFKELSI